MRDGGHGLTLTSPSCDVSCMSPLLHIVDHLERHPGGVPKERKDCEQVCTCTMATREWG